MKVPILILFLTGALLLAGCEKPKKTTVAVTRSELPPPPTPAQLRLKELTRAVQPGLTDDEVVRVAGEPQSARTTGGNQTSVAWQYELGDGNRFIVRFDKSNRVTIAGLESALRAQ